jgi:hypothetical protein
MVKARIQTPTLTPHLPWRAFLLGASLLTTTACELPSDDPPDVSAATDEINDCGLAPPTPPCRQLVCGTDHHWSTVGVTLPHACDSFLGEDSGHCDSNFVCQPNVATGYLTPKYYVLTVIYAPPGRIGGPLDPRSTVSYASSADFGTEVSADHSFASGNTIEASAGLTWPATVDFNASSAWTKTQATSVSLKISKSTSTVLGPISGSATDAIDHDFDLIYLWLNPRIYMNQTLSNGIDWSVYPSPNLGGAMDIQFVYVGWLKNPSTMPPGVVAALNAYGITSADFPAILAADPVQSGAPLDPNRFVQTATTVPYEPPLTASTSPGLQRYEVKNDRSQTNGSTTTSDHTVEISAAVGLPDFLAFKNNKLKVSHSWTWSQTNAHSQTLSNSTTASFDVYGPSFGYVGPTDLAAYYDTIYGTFLFAPINRTPTVSGIVRNAQNQPVANQPITLTAGGVPYKTATRSNGQYKFFDVPAGNAQVSLNGTSWTVPVQNTPSTVDLTVSTSGCSITVGAPVSGTYGQNLHFTSVAQCDAGAPDVQWYHKVNSSFVIVKPYSASTTLDFVANEVGVGQFYATVRPHGTTPVLATSSTAQVAIADNTPQCTGVTVTAPTNSQLLRVSVAKALTAQATCPAGATAEYQFWVKRAADANWTVLPTYTTGNGTWTPPTVGDWFVTSVARSVGSHVNFQVRAPAVPVSVTQ